MKTPLFWIVDILLFLLSTFCTCTDSQGLEPPPSLSPNSIPVSDFLPTPNTAIGQCPCVKSAGSNTCMAYSAQSQASTLEELILNFKDPSILDPANSFSLDPNEVVGYSPSTKTTLSCDNDACRSCAKYVLGYFHKLIREMPDTPLRNSTMTEFQALYRRLGLGRRTDLPPYCDRVRVGYFAAPPSAALSVSDAELNDIMGRIRGTAVGGQRGVRSICHPLYASQPATPVEQQPQQWHSGSAPKRIKRASPIASTSDVKCTKKGVVGDGGFVDLCDSCWQMVSLETGYFPPFVNQLSCSSDKSCLSGKAQCNQRQKEMQVLKKSGASYTPVSISISYCCSCQIKQGSSLSNLVTG